jgi:predicted nucleic-acid-binding Zn-ribbon protein
VDDSEIVRTLPPCPECGSDQLQACVLANGANINTTLVANPNKIFGRRYSDIFAAVCTGCGYTRFYAKDPEKLGGNK